MYSTACEYRRWRRRGWPRLDEFQRLPRAAGGTSGPGIFWGICWEGLGDVVPARTRKNQAFPGAPPANEWRPDTQPGCPSGWPGVKILGDLGRGFGIVGRLRTLVSTVVLPAAEERTFCSAAAGACCHVGGLVRGFPLPGASRRAAAAGRLLTEAGERTAGRSHGGARLAGGLDWR